MLGGLLVALLGACAAEGREVAIEAGSSGGKMFFRPSRVEVAAGEKVVFVVKNTDSVDHEFESDAAGFGEVMVPAGQTRKVPWTAPAQRGTIEIECDLPGHKEAGMVMEVEVK